MPGGPPGIRAGTPGHTGRNVLVEKLCVSRVRARGDSLAGTQGPTRQSPSVPMAFEGLGPPHWDLTGHTGTEGGGGHVPGGTYGQGACAIWHRALWLECRMTYVTYFSFMYYNIFVAIVVFALELCF